MGNKNGGASKGANLGGPGKEDGGETITGIVSRDEPSPGAELLAELQSLGENADDTLLPHSLHQIAEAYSAKEDYQAAIQFLQLEKLYHERLLSNLGALQRSWENQRRRNPSQSRSDANAGGAAQRHMETLRHICRTHLKPCVTSEQNTSSPAAKDALSDNEASLLNHEGEAHQEEEEKRGEEEEEEESSSPDALVSILKRRRASLDGLPPPSDLEAKQNSTRKVHFSEPDDGGEQDEVGGDSCLILLLLCLVTVVISVGGTALYCTLVDTYSNVCADFSLNVDFYLQSVRRFVEGLRHWLPLQT